MRRLASISVLGLALSLLGVSTVGCDGESSGTDAGMGGTDSGTLRDGGGGGTDSGMPRDGGGGGTDAGPPDAGPPSCLDGRIRIEETCPAFTACGGDVVGSWCYADICVTQDEILDQVFAANVPGVSQDCRDARDQIMVRRSTGSVSGTIDITASMMTRMVTTSATGTFFIPEPCVIVNCAATGAAINAILTDAGTGSATCRNEPDSDACECDITFFSTVDEEVSYSIDSVTNTIVTGSGRRFDYCVDSAGLRFKEGGDDPVEPGIQLALEVAGG